MTPSPAVIRLGFIPLIDCAALAVARERDFAAQEGLEIDARKEGSWAAIRDKVAFGLYDGAHMLAGIPLACRLGLGGVRGDIIAPMALGFGGNAITVSNTLYDRLLSVDPGATGASKDCDPSRIARALARVIASRKATGEPPLSFATVFPFSSHNYELRYWLATEGIDPDRDLNMGIIAPPRMVESLRSGWIDGYCVGEPWNLRAEAEGMGHILLTKRDIWPCGPEKILGLNEAWAKTHGEVVARLVSALAKAARWADRPENRADLSEILSRPEYINQDATLIRRALDLGRHMFFETGATYPWRAHGTWLLSQMTRWGQITAPADLTAVAETVYRPDIYRAALESQMDLPGTEPRILGANAGTFLIPGANGTPFPMAPDRFLDGGIFDREDPVGYAFAFPIAHPTLSPSDLRP
ncbi:MAG: ABC transporter substrate-binding protein [Rhodospirillum sp.]|nr:ABC transporter substrate-binding protein [Rhodospirillum sp.]MCF8488366.1 ABC transporter substrate-binding protein [Rhodospirillum sp.]MCF8500624.1 ABC transporter substrate-binding protein [Rhodospirillum sp.]